MKKFLGTRKRWSKAERAALRALIFQMFKAGNDDEVIAEKLNLKGWKTPTGLPIKTATVQSFRIRVSRRNPAYQMLRKEKPVAKKRKIDKKLQKMMRDDILSIVDFTKPLFQACSRRSGEKPVDFLGEKADAKEYRFLIRMCASGGAYYVNRYGQNNTKVQRVLVYNHRPEPVAKVEPKVEPKVEAKVEAKTAPSPGALLVEALTALTLAVRAGTEKQETLTESVQELVITLEKMFLDRDPAPTSPLHA